MAKKNKVDYLDYLKEKKNSAIVITVCIIAVIIVLAAVLTVLAWGSEGFTNWNVPSWFNGWGKNVAQVVPNVQSKTCNFILVGVVV